MKFRSSAASHLKTLSYLCSSELAQLSFVSKRFFTKLVKIIQFLNQHRVFSDKLSVKAHQLGSDKYYYNFRRLGLIKFNPEK